MNQTCANCSAPFEITDSELRFIDDISPVINDQKLSIPSPTRCPSCRLQRRLSHRNEIKLYRRKCDLTQKDILSIYSPDKPFVVYDTPEWWKDNWDALEHGREFDFSRPFFDQFRELMEVVPRMSVLQERNENSAYTNNVSNLKDCYMLSSSDFNRNCYYGVWTMNSKDCMDNILLNRSELAYGCIFSDNMYASKFCTFCSQCRDSAFLFDCHNCADCFMSYGLRNKQYYIANKKYSREEYFDKMKQFPISSHSNLMMVKKQFEQMIVNAPHLYIYRKGKIFDSTGDYLMDTEKCKECYHLTEGKDCTYSLGYQLKDALDCTYCMGEMGYENCECFPMAFQSAFNLNSYHGSNLYYCDHCMNNCANLFGCISLKHKNYCILNKQYSKEEYEELLPRIIEHMKNTGEWGEFFPSSNSCYGYNETNAQEEFPMSKEDVISKGLTWLDEDEREYQPSTYSIPDDINDVPDTILEEVLACEATGKNYKIIEQELELYRRHQLPIPRECFDQRHLNRYNFMNPRKLSDRNCIQCNKELESTFAPEKPEKIYCEDCYLETLY